MKLQTLIGWLSLALTAAAVGTDTPEEAALRARAREQKPVTDDGFVRPEIRNGTWYMNGRPVFWVGPWLGNRMSRHFGSPKTNPLGIRHRAYNEPPSKELWNYMGFNSAQVSSAPGRDGRVEHGFPYPDVSKAKSRLHANAWTAAEWEQEVDDYYRRFKGMPMVVDFAFGYTDCYTKEDFARFGQKTDVWHHFIPFCPESPEGRSYYRDFFLGGAKSVLRHGGNVFLWELFNESSYNCVCAYNLRAFAARMRERYGTIGRANATWGDSFGGFDEIAALDGPKAVRAHRGLWYDWCRFAEDRYAEILREGTAAVRSVDRRANVYFCEMAAGNPPERPGMDYRKIAAATDVLAIEGGWRYGYATDYATTNGMEAVVASAGSKHFFNCDFFRALSKDAKPVVNNEHYCQRYDDGERVPSHREDFITSLWMELMHGVSGSFFYNWDSRWFEFKTYEQARKNVLKPGYRASSMLNPWNVPPDNLDCFRMFREELAPYAERLLPCPRTKPATVAVFFSHASMVQRDNLPRFEGVKRSGGLHTEDTKASTWYVALLHAQYPVRVVFDGDLASLGPEVKAVVFPGSDAESAAVVAAANALAERGLTVIADTAAFRFDEYMKPSSAAVSGRILRAADGATAAKLLAAADVPRYATLTPVGKGAAPLTGADVQVCDRGDFKLVAIVNLNDREPRRVQLRLSNLSGSSADRFVARDAIAGKTLCDHPLGFYAAKGIPLVLPPQERVVLTLERKGR